MIETLKTSNDGDDAEQDVGSDRQTKSIGFNSWLLKVWVVVKRVWNWTAYALGSLFLGILVLLLVIALITGSVGGGNAANERRLFGDGVDKIVVLPIEGIIGEAGSSVFGGGVGISAEIVRASLEQAKNDPLVKAVVLQVNSPGGSAVVSDEIYAYLMDFRKDSSKPVVASFGDTAASGGYYIAAAADKIVANSASLTGSIGVIMEYYNAAGLLDKVGVSPEVIKSGTYKDIGSSSRETTADERAILQSVVNEAYAQFVDRIVEGRKMEKDKVLQLADGRIYTGSQAKQNGLVDELGNLDKAVEVAMSLSNVSSATVVEYEQGGWVESLLGSSFNLEPLGALNQLVPASTGASLQYRWMP